MGVSAFAPVTEECLAALEGNLCDDDYEDPRQRAMAENLARREEDRELIRVLAVSDFVGPAQELFETELAAYGYPVMMAWMRTGEIVSKVAEKGRPLGIIDDPGWSRDDRCELSSETVARALFFFRTKVLRAGAWDYTRGSTIKSYFVGACLFQFPNVYQRWNTEHRRWHSACVTTIDEPDDPAMVRQLASGDDTEHCVIVRADLRQALSRLKADFPDLFLVATLKLREGCTDAEAARKLGLSQKMVEGQWRRYRQAYLGRGDGRR